MTFSKRLRFYGIGLSLGILVVAIFFGPRAFRCSYFPNARVLEETRTLPVVLSPSVEKTLRNQNLDSIFVYTKLLKQSKIINFNTEEMRSKPCRTYRAKYIEGFKEYTLKFRLCRDKSILDSLTITEVK